MYRGRIIDSVIIDNRNIFDTDSEEHSHLIYRTANRLHMKTRAGVIRREVLLRVGERFSPELAEETGRILRSRLSIYDAWIEVEQLESNHLVIRVVTIDQWSLSGGIDFSRDGNESRYRFWIEEKNFLGRNLFWRTEEVLQEKEDDYFAFTYFDQRFANRPFSFHFGYSNDDLNSYTTFTFRRPYYNLSQKFSFRVAVSTTESRNDTYVDSRKIAEIDQAGDNSQFDIDYRFGTYLTKLGFNYTHKYLYKDARNPRIYSTSPIDSSIAVSSFPIDSVYHEDMLSTRLVHREFVKASRIDGFGYIEDITLGTGVSIGYGRAFDPDYSDFLYDRAEIVLNHVRRTGSNYFSLAYARSYWFRHDNEFRRSSSFSARYYNNHLRFLTMASRLFYIKDSGKDGNDLLTLGGSSGLRGFDTNFRTGDRVVAANFEGRFFTNLQILSVVLGGAVFLDAGKTWSEGESFDLRDPYTSVGLGLRLHFIRGARGRVIRMDLSYSDQNQWSISVGTGQYFSSGNATLLLTN